LTYCSITSARPTISASTTASTASVCLAMSSSMACASQSGQVCIGCICPSMMANTCSPWAKNSTFLSAMPAGSFPVMAVFILFCMAYLILSPDHCVFLSFIFFSDFYRGLVYDQVIAFSREELGNSALAELRSLDRFSEIAPWEAIFEVFDFFFGQHTSFLVLHLRSKCSNYAVIIQLMQ